MEKIRFPLKKLNRLIAVKFFKKNHRMLYSFDVCLHLII